MQRKKERKKKIKKSSLERAKHCFWTLSKPCSCLVINKICLNQEKGERERERERERENLGNLGSKKEIQPKY